MKTKKIVRAMLIATMLLALSAILISCGDGIGGGSGGGSMVFQTIAGDSVQTIYTYVDGENEEELTDFPEPPVINGYTFSRWALFHGEEVDFEWVRSVIDNGTNGAVIAYYTPNDDTPYTVKHYYENADNGEYTERYAETLYGTTDTKAAVVKKAEGMHTYARYVIKYGGSQYYTDLESVNIGRNGDTEIELYYDLPRWNVSFNIQSGVSYSGNLNQSVKDGTGATDPELERRGYTLTGYDKDFSKVTGDMEITPIWDVIEYDILFNVGSGTLPDGYPDKYSIESDTIILSDYPEPIPPNDDLVFGGWLNSDGEDVTAIWADGGEAVSLTVKWDYFLKIENGVVVGINDHARSKTEIVIPSEYNGQPVHTIASMAFSSLPETVKSIEIPSSVTKICEQAFYGVYGVEELYVPDSVTEIDFGAFYACYALKSVRLPYLGMTVDDKENCYFGWAFGCNAPTGHQSVLIPDVLSDIEVCGGYIKDESFAYLSNVKSISFRGYLGDSFSTMSFLGCSSLESLSIDCLDEGVYSEDGFIVIDGVLRLAMTPEVPDRATEIGTYAFGLMSETKLCADAPTSLVIPSTITKMHNASLYGLNSLVSLSLPFLGENLTAASKSENLRNARLGWLFTVDSGIGHLSTPDTLVELTVRGGGIGAGAIEEYTNLKTLHLGKDVTFIGYAAFRSASSSSKLETVTCDSGCTITEIGAEAFYGVESLKSLSLPEKLASIGSQAFFECKALESVKFNGSELTSIGDRAFARCEALSSLTLPDSVQSIGKYAFHYCKALTEVHLPSSLTSVGEGVFTECQKLNNVVVPGTLKIMAMYMFDNCIGLTDITVSEGVEIIDSYALAGIGAETLVLPKSLNGLNTAALSYCLNLKVVKIAEGRNADTQLVIEGSAFAGCSGLELLEIGRGGALGEGGVGIVLEYGALDNVPVDSLYIGEAVEEIIYSAFNQPFKTVTFENVENWRIASAMCTTVLEDAGENTVEAITESFNNNMVTYGFMRQEPTAT